MLLRSVVMSLDAVAVAACALDAKGAVLLCNQSFHERFAASGQRPAASVDLPWRGGLRLQLWPARVAERLREQTALLEATLERMEQGVLMVNAARIVEVCNRRAMELLDLPPALMRSRPRFAEVLAYQWSRDEFSCTPEDIRDFVRGGGILDRPHRYDRTRPDGSVIEVHSVPIDGGGVLRTYTDITERKRREERLQHVARHDALTSLANRAVLLERLQHALEHEATSRRGLAVLYLDLDGFKAVNDQLGHAVGDRLLTVVATRMRAAARQADLVARMGGDEFAVLRHGVGQASSAADFARRIVDAVSQPVALDGHRLQVGVSIGIAVHDGQPATPADLLQRADRAMYAAKAAGRGSVCVEGSAPLPGG